MNSVHDCFRWALSTGTRNIWHKKAKKIVEEIKYPLVQIILSSHRAALIVAREGDYEKAKWILQAGLKMARELGDTAVTDLNLARIGQHWCPYPESIRRSCRQPARRPSFPSKPGGRTSKSRC
ncbi:MAG: hypothetical protein H6669_17660 [Ardenticatenaceae bacterium]|nr:hypothetical protein [Ardenticatenaceae bacterium]